MDKKHPLWEFHKVGDVANRGPVTEGDKVYIISQKMIQLITIGYQDDDGIWKVAFSPYGRFNERTGYHVSQQFIVRFKNT